MKLRPRKLRPQTPKKIYGHKMFIGGKSHYERIKIFTFSRFIAVMSGGYKADFDMNNIIDTSVKKFASKCHQSVSYYFKPF